MFEEGEFDDRRNRLLPTGGCPRGIGRHLFCSGGGPVRIWCFILLGRGCEHSTHGMGDVGGASLAVKQGAHLRILLVAERLTDRSSLRLKPRYLELWGQKLGGFPWREN